jgi:hypothetical protein
MTGTTVRPIAPASAIRASDFRSCQKGESLQGFFVWLWCKPRDWL